MITITIGGDNTAPEFDGLEQIILIEDDMMWDGDTFEFDIPAGFAGGELGDLPATDPDTGDTLTWSISSAHGFSIDPTTGTLSYTPVLTTGTLEGLWAYVQDDSGDTYNNTDQAYIIINFAAGNNTPPEFDGTEDENGMDVFTFEFSGSPFGVIGTLTATDPDYDTLTFSGGNSDFEVSETGEITRVIAGGGFAGTTHRFTATVTDGEESDEAEVVIHNLFFEVDKAIDLDIDSDNTNGVNSPDLSDWEEELEEHTYGLGKLVMQSDPVYYPNQDFTPIVIQIPSGLDSNNPNIRIRLDYETSSDAGDIYVYDKQRAFTDKQILYPGVPYSLQQLGNGLGNIQLFVRGLSENAGIKTLKGVEDNGKPDETISAVLELFEKETWNDVATDGAKYIVAQTDSFLYRLQTDSRVRDGLISRGVYGHETMPSFSQEALSGDQLATLGVDSDVINLLSGSSGLQGFMSALYRDYLGGPDTFTLGFAGTDPTEAADIIENMRQGLGWGQLRHYPAAMDIAIKLQNQGSQLRGRFHAVGHSLGGGLASAASIASNIPAVTFNAAGLHQNTIYKRDPLTGEFELDEFNQRIEIVPGLLGVYNSGATSLVTAHYVDHDLLTYFQTNTPAPNALGTSHELDGPYDADLVAASVWLTNPLIGYPAVITTMGYAHLAPAFLHGILVDETNGIDLLGYGTLE